MKVYEFEGKNQEELILLAKSELNVDTEDIIIELTENQKKLFKTKKFKLKVILKSDIKQFIKQFINSFFSIALIDIKVEILEISEIFNINIETEASAILIGKDGKNLAALQIILRQALINKFKKSIKVNLDIANYKAKRVNRLEYQIQNIAKEIISTKIDVKLDPMNSYERRIVHNIINSYNELSTESVGESPNRYIIIHYKEK